MNNVGQNWIIRDRRISGIITSVPILVVLITSVPILAGLITSVPILAKEKEEKINVSSELKRLKSKKINEKLSAIEKLGKARDKTATKEIINELKTSKDSNVKSVAVITLGNVESEEADAVLKEIFLDGNEELSVRLDALEALSRKKDNADTFNVLIKATEDKNPVIRRVAIGFLWQNFYSQKKNVIKPILEKMLSDPEKDVSESVKQMLEVEKKLDKK